MSIDCVRLECKACVCASVASGESDSGTAIMSTSFWLDSTSPSKSDAGLLSGDDDRSGRSAAPPIIVLCENGSNGD